MKTEKLGNICDIIGGFAFKSEFYKDIGIPIIRISNIQNERIVINEQTVYYNNDSEPLNDFLIQKGDILIALSGATTGKFGIYNLEKKALLNQRVGLLRTIPTKLHNKYLFFYLFKVRNEIFNIAQGVAQPNLSNKDLENLKIPLPSLEEQKRIADTLDKADALRQKRKQSIQLLDDYLKSVFYDMFGNPEKNEKDFKKARFGNYVEDIIAGSSYGGKQKNMLVKDEFGVLKVSAVTWGYFNPNEFKVVKEKELKGEIVHPKKGDLLFSRANTRELVGASCIVDKNYPRLFLPDKLWKIKLKDDELNKIFVHYLFKNKTFRNTLTRNATGTSGSMLNISMEKLRNIKFAIPPIDLQNQFAQTVGQVEQTKSKMDESLKEIDNLFNSLMNKFFYK